MYSRMLLKKIDSLPFALQQEVVDFVDFLLSRKAKSQELSEPAIEYLREASAAADTENDFLSKKELEYYLNLKDES